jgi:long-chain acyl-CoA synthetase
MHAILAGDGSPAPQGSPGELVIQTPYGMAGYLDDPALTREAFAGSYFRTGDLARALPDGSVALVGRLKEIVSRGGNKISPQEIDNLLGIHPDVVASLTAGVPDARLGGALNTLVVLTYGAVATPATLQAWLTERIERYKVPDVIELGDTLPTGPTGKASRAVLRAGLLAREES